jgi:hypothetical protein
VETRSGKPAPQVHLRGHELWHFKETVVEENSGHDNFSKRKKQINQLKIRQKRK